jgi:SAM-dependent methyltransferase
VRARRAWPSADPAACPGLDRIAPLSAPLTGDLWDPVRPGERVLDMPWRRGDALPYADASFDVVVWRQGLQLLADRAHALAELRRVLVPGGRATISVCGPIERSPAFAALADSLERRAGVRAAAAVRWLFSLPEPEELRALLACAGLEQIRVRTARRTTRFPSVAEFLRRTIPGSPTGSATADMPDSATWSVVADMEAALDPWVDAGGLRITTQANVGVAWSSGLRPPAPRG